MTFRSAALFSSLLLMRFTSPDLADPRDFCGTHGDSEVILVNDGPVKWPDDLKPEAAGKIWACRGR